VISHSIAPNPCNSIAHQQLCFRQKIEMEDERTISIKGLKTKLGSDKNFIVVERLAPERYPKRTSPEL
jgi:hypothetical protein